MSAKVFVTFASGASAIAILVAITSVAVLLSDINSFYDDAITDLGEFKVSGWQKASSGALAKSVCFLGVRR